MGFDKKEKFIFEHYKKILEERIFDEYDILGFLIFIRRHISSSKYPYIRDFADLIAHRNRKRGKIMECIDAGITHHHETLSGPNVVKGYSGMNYNDWEKEWFDLATEFEITLSAPIIIEITVCAFSLAQCTEYVGEKSSNKGKIELFQGKDNCLALASVAAEKGSPYICFSKVGSFDYKKQYYFGIIDEPVEAVRIDGTLHLKTATEYII